MCIRDRIGSVVLPATALLTIAKPEFKFSFKQVNRMVTSKYTSIVNLYNCSHSHRNSQRYQDSLVQLQV